MLLGALPKVLSWLVAPADWMRSIGKPGAPGLMMDTYMQVVAAQSAVFMVLLLVGLWGAGFAIAWLMKWLLGRHVRSS
jgi:hypothetical protein